MTFLKKNRLKKEEPLIEFFSLAPGLELIEECIPKPTKSFTPDWWKAIPSQVNKSPENFFGISTVKMCPSFPDYFSQGFVVTMWADTLLTYDESSATWNSHVGAQSGSNPFSVEAHINEQFIDHVNPTLLGSTGNFVFKLNCPWKIKTPKNYSVLQLPMFYHFNSEFSVLPGVIHTDIHHDINQQLVYYGNGKEIFIPRGTPLAQYIPFKRNKYTHEVRSANAVDRDILVRKALGHTTKFFGEYRLRKNESN